MHNTPRGGDNNDSARDYMGRSLRVAREEAEREEEEEEEPVLMEGNYMSTPYSGGRCFLSACYTEADGTGVDYGNTPNTSPVRDEEENKMEVEEGRDGEVGRWRGEEVRWWRVE